MEIEVRNNTFEMLAQKAVFWKDTDTLLIGDLHLGKITHFRKEGIAAPSNASVNNINRLDSLMQITCARRVFFLGDLFHNAYNKEWDRFSAWRENYTGVEMSVVLGNHDILPQQLLAEANIYSRNFITERPFIFAHHPDNETADEWFVFCGHIHPVYCIRSTGRQYIKLPCFVHDMNQMILPSFGVFTGGYEIQAERRRKIYVIAGDKVIEAR